MTSTIEELREQAQSCTACDLYKDATQTVFGQGSGQAKVVMIGEQPGDKEDLAGQPFIGPAGHMLDNALQNAGIERSDVYITNAVKHFKWKPQGKVRLHQKPLAREVKACRPWLEGELAALQPEVIVLLGATAAQAMLGSSFRLTQHRGEWLEVAGVPAIATLHPSAILRTPDPTEREAAFASVVDDLLNVAKRMGGSA